MEIISHREAKEKGLKHYFTGMPCKHGHLSLRRVCDRQCGECRNGATRNWKDSERGRKKESAWRENNKQKLNAQERARYAKNPDRHIDKVKRQYTKNGERIRARRKAYHYVVYDDPEVRAAAQKRTREWAKANPERARTNARNSKAKRKHVPGKHSLSDIKEILKLQNRKCAYCKVRLGDKFHVDHILPVSRGGTNGRANLQITCAACNLSKAARHPIEFSRQLGMLL